MSTLKITQTRSQIRRPGGQKRTLVALGLGRIGKTVEHEATPQIRGMVAKVQHMVSVEEA
ncbi:50S ribosomal protein L30 [Rubrivirga sp. IMCC43871]|uniref:50S ribosomal protein L30 n=1 Tax=Rubrivirga sp. IMCC43871 TaxID=3391575 RepID=UPI00399003E5